MHIVQPKATIEQIPTTSQALLLCERAARKAYKSESLGGTLESSERLIRNLLTRRPVPHESVIEHVVASVTFICDRGVSHELVRHRLCSFTQESTRYCNYSLDKFGNDIAVIEPEWFGVGGQFALDQSGYSNWYHACETSEREYLALISKGWGPQQARAVLPNSLKTEIMMTANFRQWRHIFALRCHKTAHPQMRQIMQPLLKEFIHRHPTFFENLQDVEELLPNMDRPEIEIAEDLIAA
jgi:thymidylate synthase (FAD)